MPILQNTSYRAPHFYQRDLATVAFARFGRIETPLFRRELLPTDDGDPVALDWAGERGGPMVILVHGLEGSSESAYIRRFATTFSSSGWEVVAMNFKGCGGAPNALPTSYHSGASDQVRAVVQHLRAIRPRQPICVIGVSLGGNVVLNLVAEESSEPVSRISGAAAFSVPCDLASCSIKLGERRNFLYQWDFVRSLRSKLSEKARQFPDRIDAERLASVKSIWDIDENFTAPIHGFRDANDYYTRCSSGPKIPLMKIPTLIVNALDDPFLAPACFPFNLAEQSPFVTLECPARGGHVAFPLRGGGWWPELRAREFLESAIRA